MATPPAVRPERDSGLISKDGRPPRNTTDEEILLLLHDPEMASLGAELLYRKYELQCLRIAGRWSRDDSIARDLAHDVLARFIEHETGPRASFTPGRSIGAYLASSIRYAYVDHVARQAREEKFAPPRVSTREVDAMESVPATETLPLDRLIASQQSTVVQQCLSRLPAEDLHLLTLRYLDEPPWTLQQIADELGLAVSTVKYRIDQLLRLLRRMLVRAGVEGVFHATNE